MKTSKKVVLIIICILIAISGFMSAISACGIAYAKHSGVYDNAKEESLKYAYYDFAENDTYEMFTQIINSPNPDYGAILNKGNLQCTLTIDNTFTYNYIKNFTKVNSTTYVYTYNWQNQLYCFTAYISNFLDEDDHYVDLGTTIQKIYDMGKPYIYMCIASSSVLLLCVVIFLILYRKDRLKYDLLSADIFLIANISCLLLLYTFCRLLINFKHDFQCFEFTLKSAISPSILLALILIISLQFIRGILIRIQSGTLQSFYICRKFPSIKRLHIYTILYLITILVLVLCKCTLPTILITLIFCIYVFLYATKLSHFQKKIQILSSGNLEYRYTVKHPSDDMKDSINEFNNIGNVLKVAVEERMKSEHLKTELITNVSHDIKTPLTSIINYADLLSREELNNEKAMEYVATISKHSERLKRLIEDLIEASKASSGNLEVSLEKSDIGIMLTQIAGEYEEKASSKNLHFIINKPEEPVHIMADGRRMFRVFDNLLNNICKYSMPGTRVYLTLTYGSVFANIEFKNISEYELNITSDELMERFVRGDISRHTDGNGLGLSIAKDLVKLQNGTMKIQIDGDLYKVTLSFPLYHD